MRKLTLSIFALLFTLSTVAAQDLLEKGKLSYEITDVQAEDPNMASQVQMMKGSKMDMYINGDEALTVMNMMNGMIKQMSHVNHVAETMDLYVDAMGQKIKTSMNIADLKGEADKKPEYKVESFKDETKTIAGYEAYKVVVSSDVDGETVNMTLYITDEIKTKHNSFANLSDEVTEQLEGLALEFTVDQKVFAMTMTAQEISKELDESVFEIDGSGYKEMSEEEFKQMGGGMGF